MPLTHESQPESASSSIVTRIEKPLEWWTLPQIPEGVSPNAREGCEWVRTIMDHPEAPSQPVSEGADWARERIPPIQQQLKGWLGDLVT
ncbi:MAG: hypothetical protein AAGF95_09085 [Chloroflexota bacterium]